jgi:hypothetical protein
MPLYEWKVTKQMVKDFFASYKFDLSETPFGSNCDLCFHKPTFKIIEAIRQNPQSAEWWIEQETQTSKCFHQNKIYYKDLLYLAQNQSTIFDNLENDGVNCFCTD